MEIGKILVAIRKDRKLSQTEVAAKLETAQPYLSQIESGEKEITLDMLKRLCRLYKVPYEIVVVKSLNRRDVKKANRELYDKLFPIVNDLSDKILFDKGKKDGTTNKN